MNVYHAARTAGWSRHWSFGISTLRSADTPRRRRLFGILRPSFSRHTATASAVRYLPLFVQPTYHAGVGFSISSALRSADIPRRRRLFGILRSSFSRHTATASALRHSSLFFQPTHLAGVGCSAFFALRSADTSLRRRLFGIFRSSFSRHITQVSAVHSLGYSICNSRFLQPDIPASKSYRRDLYLPCHTNPPNVLLSVFHLERAYGNPKCCC